MPTPQEIARYARETGKLKQSFGYIITFYLYILVFGGFMIAFLSLIFSNPADTFYLLLIAVLFSLLVVPRIVVYVKHRNFVKIDINSPSGYIFTAILRECDYYSYEVEYSSEEILIIWVLYDGVKITVVADGATILVNSHTHVMERKGWGQINNNNINRMVIEDIIEEADMKYRERLSRVIEN